ncbi:MAG TPA: rhodanese-like domain-containing protein [Puia sp.]
MKIFQKLFGSGQTTDLKNAIEQGAFLVDVRTQAEFAQDHVKGSVNIPLDKIPVQISQFKGKKNIIVFCLSGGRSSMAKSILEKNGFTRVINGGTWKHVNQLVNNT